MVKISNSKKKNMILKVKIWKEVKNQNKQFKINHQSANNRTTKKIIIKTKFLYQQAFLNFQVLQDSMQRKKVIIFYL